MPHVPSAPLSYSFTDLFQIDKAVWEVIYIDAPEMRLDNTAEWQIPREKTLARALMGLCLAGWGYPGRSYT